MVIFPLDRRHPLGICQAFMRVGTSKKLPRSAVEVDMEVKGLRIRAGVHGSSHGGLVSRREGFEGFPTREFEPQVQTEKRAAVPTGQVPRVTARNVWVT